ncbi:hypothetical protein [Bacillus thuringiensis]|uniref:Uncharacterized protein n=1 Tax=Bacillus thuringiensis serovar vazensis TaxID=180867 RepID=A0A243CV25_BACTU|nr:hypothetical protein [Bacillus thuringiensis]OTY74150.1 hypothetical protein BK749_16000 [Bacillus thuringiensis serovar vazensis]OTY74277.1 hypothetical protein BK749_15925 [Bacillus thuringiensis serovar vazensis]OTY74983.1 hypothetical protein BK749_14670 [Bacillus thuringiensis serovar vazensis]OTY74997.1 hypothetical protein BK749_14635 [Bacillus thuringiensis serovar vazensis]
MSRRFHNLKGGDRIRVYSAGKRLDTEGTFIRFLTHENEDFLYWINLHGNLNYTSLDEITVEKIRYGRWNQPRPRNHDQD